jgi:hypothetical protein
MHDTSGRRCDRLLFGIPRLLTKLGLSTLTDSIDTIKNVAIARVSGSLRQPPKSRACY